MSDDARNIMPDTDDIRVDREIAACLNPDAPRSFFLFAGAGSGKTRSLVNALKHVQGHFADDLRSKGQRVAVITYTNAATEEIQRRLSFDPLVDVRTIHSFCWALIGGLNHDIREWLRTQLPADISETEAEEAKGRKGTKASQVRLAKIKRMSKRLEGLDSIHKFIYSPTGDNRGRDSLSHSEVLKITASFLLHRPIMQSILTGRHPIVLVDESQDTNRDIVDSLLAVQKAHRAVFALGFLGDMMQRIYPEGKDNIEADIPTDWATPAKYINHRSPARVVTLINKIRSLADDHQQVPRSDGVAGIVRLFIVPNTISDKSATERAAAARMSEIANDPEWKIDASIKTLTLEHKMAARRMGFSQAFDPLYAIESSRTGFLRGELPITRFLADKVLPLVRAQCANNHFAVARIMTNHSPLLERATLLAAPDKKLQLEKADRAVAALGALFDLRADPNLESVFRCLHQNETLSVPDSVIPFLSPPAASQDEGVLEGEDVDEETKRATLITEFLQAPFSQVEPMMTYLAGNAHFDTHQGVKGREFDRVMVVMDDSEAKGFSFKYDSLFGGKSKGEKIVEATRRLFYVTCSRAKRSLALVLYTSTPTQATEFVFREGWFSKDEIISDLDT